MNQGLSTRSKVIFIIAVIVCMCVYSISFDKYHVNKIENHYSEISKSMSRTDVFRLLGAPGQYGRYARGGEHYYNMLAYGVPPNFRSKDIWTTDSKMIVVYCDSEDKVISHYSHSGYCQSPPIGILNQIVCAFRWVAQV